MKRILSIYFLITSVLLTLAAQKKVTAYTVDQVPNVHLADKRLYTTDAAQMLSAEARDSVDAICARLERNTGIETAVVILPSIGEATPFNFATELFRTWGIGKEKSNNGLLVLYVVDQHKVRFETGYGLEGDLPDAICKRIQQQYIIPQLKQGNWDQGVVDGMKSVYQMLCKSTTNNKEATEGDDTFAFLFLIGAIAFMICLPTLMSKYRSRCPKCGQRAMKRVKSERLKTVQGHIIRRDTYRCEKCGHILTKDHREDDNDSGNALAAGMFLGSMMGRGGSKGGGGFTGGGSFGGGSTGGGGAESGW